MTDWNTMRALLESIPDLDGARCKHKSDLFERTIGEHRMTGQITTTELDDARSAALRQCAACPALDPCRAWLDALPAAQRPRGVIAGQIVNTSGAVKP
ncbi:hypothetical protein [Mycolicibacterium psychrotolerans]|uniref:4Fe-4S Wbl-type domain-containing protein n=1 Tax=Mycolicibacterium psychrotolerans TaxID=216929 RepID=A0A7I7MC46_9MYCO|nr:hypothetical protein [Mycolicibacterium psychrotolerans]BBX69735.1 hypothetical protein MPSYJ_31960 [Mycolicibacterium psychrotolerans]